MPPTSPSPTRRSGRQRLLFWTAAAVAGCAALAGLSFAGAQRPAAAPATAPPPLSVPVAVLAPRPVAQWHEVSGQLEAVAEVVLRSRVAGAIAAVHFREGSLVQAGDLLVTLDQAPFLAEQARAEAALAAALAQRDFAAMQQRRALRLHAEKAIAQVDLERASSAEQQAQAAVAGAGAALDAARLNLGYTRIRAPIAGKVGRIEATVGNLVAAGPQTPPLTTLVAVSPMYAGFDLGPALLRQLGGGKLDGVQVRADTGAVRIEGKLHAIGNRFDGATGTVRARALFDNPAALLPGQFVRVSLRAAQAVPVILAPESAIGTDQDRRFVYVLAPDDTVIRREVVTGAPAAGLRIVSAGLAGGERILLGRLQHVQPGQKVAPYLQAMASSGAP